MDKTTQGLNTLAEYMGEKPFTVTDVHKVQHLIYPPYNTSWDALVPVYAKLMSQIDFNAPIELENHLIDKYQIAHDTDNVHTAFEAVVELVTLINKENGK